MDEYQVFIDAAKRDAMPRLRDEEYANEAMEREQGNVCAGADQCRRELVDLRDNVQRDNEIFEKVIEVAMAQINANNDAEQAQEAEAIVEDNYEDEYNMN